MNWYDVCLQCCDTLATCRLDYRGKIEISQNSGDVSGLTSFCRLVHEAGRDTIGVTCDTSSCSRSVERSLLGNKLLWPVSVTNHSVRCIGSVGMSQPHNSRISFGEDSLL